MKTTGFNMPKLATPVALVLLIALFLIQVAPLLAQDSPDTRCEEGDKWYPGGISADVGSATFMFCNASKSGTGFIISGSPTVANSGVEIAGLRYHGIIYHDTERYGWKSGFPNDLPKISAGGVTYSVQALSASEVENVAQGGQPRGWATYHAAAQRDIPEHKISCNLPPATPVPDGLQCTLRVIYDNKNDIFFEQVFLFDLDHEFRGFGTAEFGLHNLPAHVQGLVRTYRSFEVDAQPH